MERNKSSPSWGSVSSSMLVREAADRAGWSATPNRLGETTTFARGMGATSSRNSSTTGAPEVTETAELAVR
jgi:hypothetical protein